MQKGFTDQDPFLIALYRIWPDFVISADIPELFQPLAHRAFGDLDLKSLVSQFG
jgi:hypothetical protein